MKSPLIPLLLAVSVVSASADTIPFVQKLTANKRTVPDGKVVVIYAVSPPTNDGFVDLRISNISNPDSGFASTPTSSFSLRVPTPGNAGAYTPLEEPLRLYQGWKLERDYAEINTGELLVFGLEISKLDLYAANTPVKVLDFDKINSAAVARLGLATNRRVDIRTESTPTLDPAAWTRVPAAVERDPGAEVATAATPANAPAHFYRYSAKVVPRR